MADALESLNPMQREAVLHGDGPLLILAGAGSGKTRTLTHRVAHLIGERGVPPYRILAVTFTNKAAGELRERVVRLVGSEEVPWVSTFHSTCARILRREIQALGFTSTFAIYDDQDQERLIKDCLHDLDISDQLVSPRSAAGAIDAAKNRGVAADDFDRNDAWSERIGKVYSRYQQKLRQANAVDFGDLLLLALRLFQEHADVLARYAGRFLHVLVDEFQDTNRVQYELTRLLVSQHRNLCVVGDDDQSIYRWRGAEVGNILEFENDFPGAHVIRLEQNYRSTGTILAAAGAVVARNRHRKGKTLWTQNPQGDKVALVELDDDLNEAAYVSGEIERLRGGGHSLRDVAVFYRTNAQSRVLEEALVRQRLPYAIFGGVKFYARAEVKDVLAYLRVLVNPTDSISAKRIVNVPARGIGNVTVERIAVLEDEAGGFLSACELALERGVVRGAAQEKVKAFLDLVAGFRRSLHDTPFPQVAAHIVDASGYGAMLREDASEQGRDRLQNLEELLKGMEEMAAGEKTLQEYLEQVALVTDLDKFDQNAERVTLMTLHSAKGLEFPFVFMTAMEEGLFPLARSAADEHDMEEERRLCYVGMTRAMRKLYLTCAGRRRVYGDFQSNRRSRFLDEIPPDLLDEVVRTTARYGAAERRPSSFGGYRRSAPAPTRAPAGVTTSYDDDEVRIVYDDDGGALRAGSRVRHAMFGVGVIQSVEGRGDAQKATILFRSAGTKKLILRFAGLEPA
jgi:DNA helicase-2/ATP-dependent DNA helicase PcrA